MHVGFRADGNIQIVEEILFLVVGHTDGAVRVGVVKEWEEVAL
jgi:hypothetical protein